MANFVNFLRPKSIISIWKIIVFLFGYFSDMIQFGQVIAVRFQSIQIYFIHNDDDGGDGGEMLRATRLWFSSLLKQMNWKNIQVTNNRLCCEIKQTNKHFLIYNHPTSS